MSLLSILVILQYSLFVMSQIVFSFDMKANVVYIIDIGLAYFLMSEE